ncbi:MAG: cyanophycinase [Firmicutes bacterium]|jgi:cyanophycinase|nr:cyanophycinase [Bacillota bacterium]
MKRKLLIIGGAEDKDGPCRILKRFLELTGPEPTVAVISTASEESREVGTSYYHLFRELGAKEVEVLELAFRKCAQKAATVRIIESSRGIFFTGGDQLRLASLLCGTKVHEALISSLQRGAVIAGTSAGASAMSSTMIVGGLDEVEPQKIAVSLAAGLGFLSEAVVDQHFAQRGRIGRLLAAIAQSPHLLGIGIDEDTALCVEDSTAEVIGSGAVTILDARELGHVNVSELSQAEPLALTNVCLHILPQGYKFDLAACRPIL